MNTLFALGAFVWHWDRVLEGISNGRAEARSKREVGILLIGNRFVDTATGRVLCRQRRGIFIPWAAHQERDR